MSILQFSINWVKLRLSFGVLVQMLASHEKFLRGNHWASIPESSSPVGRDSVVFILADFFLTFFCMSCFRGKGKSCISITMHQRSKFFFYIRISKENANCFRLISILFFSIYYFKRFFCFFFLFVKKLWTSDEVSKILYGISETSSHWRRDNSVYVQRGSKHIRSGI